MRRKGKKDMVVVKNQKADGEFSPSKANAILSKLGLPSDAELVLELDKLKMQIRIESQRAYFTSGDMQDAAIRLLRPYFEGKVLVKDHFIYTRSESSGWTRVGEYKPDDLGIALNRRLLRFSSDCFTSAIKRMVDAISPSISDQLNNFTIQYADCYSHDGHEFEVGIYTNSLPFAALRYPVLQLIETRQFTVEKVSAVDELLSHLANEDKATLDRMLDDLALIFATNKEAKAKSARALRFYGPTARNGKSTFFDLCERSFSSDLTENSHSFKMNGLRDDRTVYAVANSLLAIEQDASNTYIDEEASSTFKSIITGDGVKIRKLFKEEVNAAARALVLSASNGMPKSADKTKGMIRRIDWIETYGQLVKSDEWFKAIRSEKAAHYLFELLFLRYLELEEKDYTVHDQSDHMKSIEARFISNNNSADQWLNSNSHDVLLANKLVSDSYSDYLRWCNDEHEKPLGKMNFISVVSENTDYFVKRVYARTLGEYSKLDIEFHATHSPQTLNKRVDAWFSQD